jgi:hypothetical protein
MPSYVSAEAKAKAVKRKLDKQKKNSQRLRNAQDKRSGYMHGALYSNGKGLGGRKPEEEAKYIKGYNELQSRTAEYKAEQIKKKKQEALNKKATQSHRG